MSYMVEIGFIGIEPNVLYQMSPAKQEAEGNGKIFTSEIDELLVDEDGKILTGM